jgi:tetratricopeptide (TPR) repeat protein
MKIMKEDFIVYRVNVLIIIFLGISFLLPFSLAAQFDEDIDEELEMIEETEGECIPADLTTVYDSLANIEYSDDEIKKWLSLGHEHYKHGDYKAAVPYLWKVFMLDSGKYGKYAVRELAESYFNLGMADTTLIVCYKGLEIFPDHPTLHYYAGNVQEKAGRINCAIPNYAALVESQPENPEYLKQLALAYLKIKNRKAIEIANKLVELDPDNKDYIDIQVLINKELGEEQDVINVLKERVKNNPTDIDLNLRLGEAAFNFGDYQTAINSLTVVINSGKNLKIAYKLRAQCYESIEKYVSSISDYKKLLEINPDDVVTMCAIADDYRNLNQFKNGVYWVQRALRAKPGSGLAYITMGDIYSSAVTYCQNRSNRTRNYDDALVYKLAYDEYIKALNDMNYRSTAKRRINSLQSFLPSTEEKFMNKNRDYIKDGCYTSWINGKVKL